MTIAEELRECIRIEFGGSALDMIEEYVRGEISELSLAIEIGNSACELASLYKRAIKEEQHE